MRADDIEDSLSDTFDILTEILKKGVLKNWRTVLQMTGLIAMK